MAGRKLTDDNLSQKIKPKYPFDCEGGRIDIDVFREWSVFHAGIMISYPNEPMSTLISVVEIPGETNEGREELIEVIRKNGEFHMRWLISIEEFVEFGTIDNFHRSIVERGYVSTRAEIYKIEYLYMRKFGHEIFEAIIPTYFDPNQNQNLSPEEIWQQALLRSMAKNLQERAAILENIKEEDEENYNKIFDLGFSTGRFLSEYTQKEELESYALEGKKSDARKQKRTKASGIKSASQRLERMRAMLREIAILQTENPAITKIDKYKVAEFAIKNAAKLQPDLFKTGKGQYREYWDYIFADPDLKSEYSAQLKIMMEKNA